MPRNEMHDTDIVDFETVQNVLECIDLEYIYSVFPKTITVMKSR